MEHPLVIETPLMWLDKGQTWALAQELGGSAFLEIVREQSHTCYQGDRSSRHVWGYDCATCPACELRKHGYDSFTQAA